MLASAPLLPKSVSEGAAMYHELRKRGTSAADLKFLHRLRQTHFRNFKSKRGTRIIGLLVPLCFRSSCQRVPQCITNFGSGALERSLSHNEGSTMDTSAKHRAKVEK